MEEVKAPASDPRDRHGLIGKELDNRFTVNGVLGEGGMGIVYSGVQTAVGRKVAIKVLMPQKTDEETVRRFQNEARAASKLHHPNTITIHDFGKYGELLYIAMEFLDGDSLQEVLTEEGALAPARTCRIMTQVLLSLYEAHNNNIIHRDIKPDNIFLKSVGRNNDFVKVLDFGVAKLQDPGDATLTKAGMIFGTPKYMSPEQARARDLDSRSDLYSVGVMMYECLCGKAPFLGSDPVSILIQHVHEPAPPFSESAPGMAIPPELEVIVAKAMSKEPEDRYESAEAMAMVIEGALSRLGPEGETTAMTGPFSHQPSPTGQGYQKHTPPHPQSAMGSGQHQMGHPQNLQSGQYQMGQPQHLQSGTHQMGQQQPPSGPHTMGMGYAPQAGGYQQNPNVEVIHVKGQGGNTGLILLVLLFGLGLLGIVGYMIISQKDDPVPNTVVTNGADGGVAVVDETDVGVASVTDTGTHTVVNAPDLAVETTDTAVTTTVDAHVVPDTTVVAVLNPDVAAQTEDVGSAVISEDTGENTEVVATARLVRVRFATRPRRVRLDFGDRSYEEDDGIYVFNLDDGEELSGRASASHYERRRIRQDLTAELGEDGILEVRVRLSEDPCDPPSGLPDVYRCRD